MTYTNDRLRKLFQSPFDLASWQDMLLDFFGCPRLFREPQRLEDGDGRHDGHDGYFLGSMDTPDRYRIGFFHYKVRPPVDNRRVGLRRLLGPYLRTDVDAALASFDDGSHWRLSFICDIRGEATAAKRYTYVFGNPDSYYNTPVSRFAELQGRGISFANVMEAFSVEALTKQFYKDLFEWYQWAVDEGTGVTFPNDTCTGDDDREGIDVKIIRMITRLMFVWFIRQKQLVPARLFDPGFLATVLRDFHAQSETEGTYYNAILQNLFFATLNRAVVDEDGRKRGFARLKDTKDLKTLYRYAEMFSVPEDEAVNLFSEIPFLNGGLFECLDKTRTLDGVEKAFCHDGFSRNDARFPDGRYRNRAFVPNALFFRPEAGLFSIFGRYNFTVEENTPNEQQIALDPELLGKVFENLLGAYNPETKETARNQSGSFYTPREIVNYMVDESVKSYLGESDLVDSLFLDDFVRDEDRQEEYAAIAGKLRDIKVLDPACGSGAFPMGLLNRLVDLLHKLEPGESIYDLKLAVIENCLYGSDIQGIAAQITKLRFFISLICDCEKDASKPNFGMPTLPNLETKFVVANSLVAKKRIESHNLFENPEIEPTKKALTQVRHEHFFAKSASAKRRLRDKDRELRGKLARLLAEDNDFAPEDAKQLAEWNPYDQNAVSPFFDPGWMFDMTDGFDIVIGNPPYIQLQNNGGQLARLYQDCGYKTFARTGDIYCLFFERGYQLLKRNGHLCYITSNKWMRAGYGENTRGFLARNTNPLLLVDFAGVKIFESATVDTNILLFSKAANEGHTICAVTNRQDKDGVRNLSVFVRQRHSVCPFAGADPWIVLSEIEQSIKRKIEAVGTPLKEWDINIYRGILTGCNEAFIINSEKRDEILADCTDEAERARTDELIRPILRGRDIKRYGYDWAGLWLINAHNGIKGVKPRIKIEDYPAVKRHLDRYWDKIKNRADQGDTPYNLRNCAYVDDFCKPKIMYSEIVREPQFYLDNIGQFYPEATTFILTGENLEYLITMFNSSVVAFLFKSFYAGGGLGEAGYRYKKQFFEKLPIPRNTKHIDIKSKEDIYVLYELNDEMIKYIENQIS